MKNMARKSTLGLVLAGTLLATACGTATVAKAKVESQIVSNATSSDGTHADSASCPGDLAATVGTTMTCTFTLAGNASNVDVVVTDVNNGDVKFSLKSR